MDKKINLKKIVIHLDDNGQIMLLEYKDIDEKKRNSFLYGDECYNYLKKLSKNKIVDIYEDPRGQFIELEYDKYVIELNNHLKLLRKKAMAPILNNIRIYEEGCVIKRSKKKKVTRKNKYTKSRIIAGGLTLLVLSGCVMGMFGKSKTKIIHNESTAIVENLEEDFVTTLDTEKSGINIITLSNKINTLDQEVPCVELEYSNRSDTPKAIKTKAYYGDLINKYSKMYGLDPKLVTAIATQERGIHSGVKDEGGATGLMQVQNEIWVGKNLSAYNFETNTRENIIVNEKSLSNVDYSVKVGCMILQTVFKYMNYNTLAAVQCYNMGYGNMHKIFNAYSCDSGKSVDEILNDVTDTNWMNYRYIIKKGDQEYIENVFSWLGDDIKLQNKNENGKEICFNVNTFDQVKTIH